MDFKAEELIQSSRDYHPAFEDTRIGDALLLRQLRRHSQLLINDVAEESPGALSVEKRIPYSDIDEALGDADGPPAVQIDPWVRILKGIRIQRDAGSRASAPIALVTHENQYPDLYDEEWDPRPSVAVTDTHMVLLDHRVIGLSTHGWEDFSGPLIYRYVPVPIPGITPKPKDNVNLPLALIPLLELKMAVYMATRLGMLKEAAGFQSDYAEEVTHFHFTGDLEASVAIE